jgi:outer membrane receptor protein involved in Fe transport
LTLLCLSPAVAASQEAGTLNGRVTDRSAGEPLAGVQVSLEGGRAVAASDSAGIYVLHRIPPGTWSVQLRRIGYAPETRTVVMRPAERVSLDVAMSPLATSLQEVTVVGEAPAQAEMRAIRQGPFSVTVLDGQRLAARGLTLDEALQRATGVQVRRAGGLGSASVFNVRGLEGQRVQVYVNGNAADLPGNAFSLDDIPLQLVDRIEIYKGVVPARFGGDGLGAAINVVTREPSGGYADLGYTTGSHGTHQLATVAQRPFARLGLDVAGSLNLDRAANDYSMESPFIPGLLIRRDHDQFRRLSAAGVLTYHRAWFDELRLEAIALEARREIQGVQTNVQHAETGSGLRLLALEGERQGALGGRFDLSMAAAGVVSSSSLTDTSSLRYTFDGQPFPSPNGRGEIGLLPSSSDNRTRFFRQRSAATYRFSPSHTVNLTTVLDLSRFRPRDSLANRYAGRNVSEFPGRQTSAVAGLSHEWRARGERLVNVLGVRGYAFRSRGTPSNLSDPSAVRPPEVTNGTTSFGASEAVRYFLSPTTLVKASVELARRLPTGAELFGDGLLVQAAPALRPERSLNLNAGVQYERAGADGRRVQLEVNGFWMSLRDMIRLAPGFAGSAAYTNLGSGRVAGMDIEAKADLTSWLYGSAGATYQDARDVLPLLPGTAVSNPTRGLRIPNMPWLFGTAALEAHAGDLFGRGQQSRVFYEGAFTEEYFYAFEMSRRQERRIPRALIHTVGVEQQWLHWGLTVSAELQNLTGARVLNQFNQPLPGRSFRVKLRYTWIGA